MGEDFRTGEVGSRSRNLLMRSNTHSDLLKFKGAKQDLQKIFAEIEDYVNDCKQFFKEKLSEEAGKRLSPALEESSKTDLEPYFERVKQIQSIISRNQMKCAFFGRTSNGKSTVINAMLGSRILPSGIGHTTSCFVQVQGTNQSQGFLQQECISDFGSGEETQTLSEPRPIESVSHLAHSLSSAKMASDSLIYLFWPSSSCHLLREDVVLLDSPGVNVDPDMDAWIDRHCLDADVFILVANAESTLMQAEKDFFYRVSSRISKPNIFILNNRWDASAGEAELADQVKEQHMQRCVSFLTDELKVCGHDEAMERVFFVSAREVLTIRARSLNGGAPPGSAPNIGSPSAGGYPLADGWQARLMEFSTFEKVFEKILSDSATRTKFASHAEQGKELAAYFRQLMETTYEAALEEKDAGIRYRRLSQARLEELRAKLQNAARTINDLIAKCLLDVEAQVANALCNEIRRLGELVDSFSGHAFAADDEATLRTYRHELNAYIERELGKKLAAACAGDIHSQVVRAEQIMASIYEGLVEADESAKSRIMQSVLSSSFEPEFHVDCRNICAEFREDLRFRFSLGLSSLAERLLHHQRHGGFYSSGSTANTWTGGYAGSQGMPEYSPVLPLFLSSLPALLSRNTVGLLVVGGIVLKATGWRMIMVLGGLYAGLYAYERLAWTNRAREAAFKSQYVNYASHKLRLIVDLTGTNARHQVKRELHQMQKRLGNEGEGAAKVLSDELVQLDKDLVTLDNITTSAKTLKNGAIYLDGCLDKFHKEYISSAWN
ncbi:Mitofusin-2 [Echinococcus granulosus]|nr:Mitofusin-2 [Echinococcus granulosus]CDS19866.1 transmembrane gtpase mfn mitofusin 1 fzo [Echinococcus granulosus]